MLVISSHREREETVPTTYRSEDGREWEVTLESPGSVMSVPPSLEKSGALLPEHEVRIVFSSEGESISEEYTELAALEDLSENDLEEWFRAAREGHGL
jgi:hypothetical protein